MALVIEDGSVVPNANSYITVDEFKAWADERGISYGTDQAVEQAIYRAMDWFERQFFIGNKANENQPLQWPRTEAARRRGLTIPTRGSPAPARRRSPDTAACLTIAMPSGPSRRSRKVTDAFWLRPAITESVTRCPSTARPSAWSTCPSLALHPPSSL